MFSLIEERISLEHACFKTIEHHNFTPKIVCRKELFKLFKDDSFSFLVTSIGHIITPEQSHSATTGN